MNALITFVRPNGKREVIIPVPYGEPTAQIDLIVHRTF
jgi:hypothetical protein